MSARLLVTDGDQLLTAVAIEPIDNPSPVQYYAVHANALQRADQTPYLNDTDFATFHLAKHQAHLVKR
jgi:hypothetical protein